MGKEHSVIAPGLTLADIQDPPTFEDKVLVFERRVEGWVISIADTLQGSVEHSGFAVLALLAGLPETIWQYRHGRSSSGASKHAFTAEMDLIVPGLTERQRELLYDRVRNGLYHCGLTKRGVALAGYEHAIEFQADETVWINPHLWPAIFRNHVNSFVSEVRDPQCVSLRENFEKAFDGRI